MQKNARHLCAIAVALVVAGTSGAYAQWSARTEGPDVFGSTKVIAVVGSSSQNGLVIQCDDKEALDLAYLSPGTESEKDLLSKSTASIPVTLLIKVDQGAVVNFEARMQRWNNTFIGLVVSGRMPKLVSLIRAIGSANGKINVGVDFGGNKQSESFGAFGSTNAVDKVIKGCNLSDIKQ